MLISIIIPCYNEEENIHTIVTSLVNIKLEGVDIEAILVQNGSTDGTLGALRRESANFPFIKVVNVEVNQGYGFGLKAGMQTSTGDYVGWLHADLQVAPSELVSFIPIVLQSNDGSFLFCKGIRSGRGFVDSIFTFGMSLFETVIFGKRLYDIGAIPVLFHRSLLVSLRDAPNDFSIELFTYLMAKHKKFSIIRKKIEIGRRRFGKSSWDTGFSSKILQSKRIIKSSFDIKRRLKRGVV